MKNSLILFCLIVILCGGCKYFSKKSAKSVDTLTADTVASNETIDSAAYYNNVTPVTQSQPPVQSGVVNGKYYMIVGCFKVSANADRYAEKLRGMGYESQIIQGPSNFQMVSARSFDNYKAGVAELEKFRNDVTPNAWVYLQR